MEVTARQVKDERNFFLMASQADYDDCVKMFVCDLSSRLDATLSDFELKVKDEFAATMSELDPSSEAVEFDLASVVGATQGPGQCRKVYARCALDYDTVLGVIKGGAEGAAQVGVEPEQQF